VVTDTRFTSVLGESALPGKLMGLWGLSVSPMGPLWAFPVVSLFSFLHWAARQ
jgi:hypothetical protein